jgi:hypothetical protein
MDFKLRRDSCISSFPYCMQPRKHLILPWPGPYVVAREGFADAGQPSKTRPPSLANEHLSPVHEITTCRADNSLDRLLIERSVSIWPSIFVHCTDISSDPRFPVDPSNQARAERAPLCSAVWQNFPIYVILRTTRVFSIKEGLTIARDSRWTRRCVDLDGLSLSAPPRNSGFLSGPNFHLRLRLERAHSAVFHWYHFPDLAWSTSSRDRD